MKKHDIEILVNHIRNQEDCSNKYIKFGSIILNFDTQGYGLIVNDMG